MPDSSGPILVADGFDGFRDALAQTRWLLITHIPYLRKPDGSIWMTKVWRQDILARLDYMNQLTILAPCHSVAWEEGLVELPRDALKRVHFDPLPAPKRLGTALLQLPLMTWRVVRALRHCDALRTSIAGWPIAPGLIANPLAVMMRKPFAIEVESTFWRLRDPAHARKRSRLRSRFNEFFVRWCIRRARVALFTHSAYRDGLSAGAKAERVLLPTTWINTEDILDPETARARWLEAKERPQLLFAAALTPEAGMAMALDAVETLDQRGLDADITVVGDGPLLGAWKDLARRCRHVQITLIYKVTPETRLALLRQHHVAIIPSLADEPPRFLFDALSQGTPVIGSDVSGHRDILENKTCGRLFAAGDAGALADCVARTVENLGELSASTDTALATAQTLTHERLHQIRARVFAQHLSVRRKGSADRPVLPPPPAFS
ncbi:MAG: glycosyltransferase [Paracoccaceae bacterium]